MIRHKQKLRRKWKRTRTPLDKTILNRAVRSLSSMLIKEGNDQVDDYLINLGASKSNEYNLFTATKYLKRPVKRKVPFKDENNEWHRSD